MNRTFLYGANVFVNDIRLHFLRYGGKGIPLILIPGITSPAITWEFVAEELGNNFDVYVIDVRGRGLSSSGIQVSYDFETCSQDIIAFVNELNLSEYYLIGHSMGARFSIRCASIADEKLKKIILIDPPVSGPNRRAYPSNLSWYIDSIKKAEKGITAEEMKEYCPTWTLEQRQLRAEWLHTCYLPAIEQAFEEFHTVDVHQFIPNIKVPTLLMVAGKGGVILKEDEKEIMEINKNISIAHVPNAGHMIPWDDFDGFFDVLYKFL